MVGADKIVRFILGGTGRTTATITVEPTVVNGNPALFMRLDDEIDGVMAVLVAGGRIAGLYYVRNPEKLAHIRSEVPLTRG